MSRPTTASPTLRERCAAIEWLVLDVDGVLTDGGITYGEPLVEIKTFHVRDGSALKRWHGAGKRSAVITGRSSPVVAKRAAELGVGVVIQGAGDKSAAFEALLRGHGAQATGACCVGDDGPDVPVLRAAGLAVAPADAGPEARAVAHYVTQARGGRGVVAEVVSLVLASQGHLG